jgi:UDP-glucose 4-epimerase
MKEILILGGGGFIGRNILEFLINQGDCNVTAADLIKGSNWDKISEDASKACRFKAVIDDFTDTRAFDRLSQNYDEVYMLAAVVGVNRTLKNPSDVIRTNSKLTINTLDWISKNPIKRLLFASSSENYAGTSDLFNIDIPTPESVPLCIEDVTHPRWTYAITKIHGESAFIHSAKKYSYGCTVIRYQNIIGPEMGFGHAIPHIVERFFKNEKTPFKIYGHDQTRAFCFIDDAVRGTVAAMNSEKAIGEIYHIGNQEEINMEELTKFIGKLIGYGGNYQSSITYPGSVSRRCPKIDKATNHFDYFPQVSWREAVIQTVEWYKDYFLLGNIPPFGGFEPPEVILKKISE